jgi:UDP-glucose 4-epimerase
MLPQPLSPYASGKVAGEHLLRVYSECYGMRTVALRYFNIFGPRQADDSPYTGVIAIFARALLQGTAAPRIYGDGLQSRDFTYIDNVVLANLLALERAPAGHSLFNVGAGEQVTLLDLYGAMAQELGVTLAPEFHPPRAGDVRHSLASLERIRATLGYEPRVGWREGLRQTVAWYRERHRRAAPVNTNS